MSDILRNVVRPRKPVVHHSRIYEADGDFYLEVHDPRGRQVTVALQAKTLAAAIRERTEFLGATHLGLA